MNISFNGYKESVATFNAPSVEPGDIVTVTSNGTVSVASENDIFAGICVGIREDVGAIRTEGYTELPYSGAAPSFGFTFLAADGDGGVIAKVAGTGRPVMVVKVDTAASVVGFILL